MSWHDAEGIDICSGGIDAKSVGSIGEDLAACLLCDRFREKQLFTAYCEDELLYKALYESQDFFSVELKSGCWSYCVVQYLEHEPRSRLLFGRKDVVRA